MNKNFTFYLLSLLINKEEEKGFTLIELLVVVIIIGILAAIALPNFLGQIGRGREVEAIQIVGSLIDNEHAYHMERGVYSPSLTNSEIFSANALGIMIPVNANKYYDYAVTGDSGTVAVVTAIGKAQNGVPDNGNSSGTRDFAGGSAFTPSDGKYHKLICRASKPGDVMTPPNENHITTGVCPSGDVVR